LLLVGSGAVEAGSIAACSSSSSGGEVTDSGSPDATGVGVDDSSIDAPAVDSSVVDSGPGADADAGDAAVEAEAGPAACPTDGGIPDDLYCTGLYSDWATKTIAADAVAYTPGLVFWSDGAVKSRWIYLPPGTTIDTTDMDNWVFPTGTKIWKQFVVAGQLVETRLIWKTSDQWTYLDYRWSADGSSAQRLDDGETNVNGSTYEIPSTSVCYECHGGRTDDVLGFDLIGLGVSNAQGVTLATLTAQGRFTQAPPSSTVTIPEDSTGKAAAALGWLHVNCGSSCHNEQGKAAATDLYTKISETELYPPDGGAARVQDLEAYTTTVNVPAQIMPDGGTYLRIAPGDPAHSLVPLMATARAPDAGGFDPMPPLVSHIPDVAGVALVTSWIEALGDAGAP
jgi:hypothetical protein